MLLMILTGADLDRLPLSSGTQSEFYGNFYAVSFLMRKVKKILSVCQFVQSFCKSVCLTKSGV